MQPDRERARELLGEIGSAMVVVKANGRDPSLLSMKRALDLDIPVAAVSGARDSSGKVQNIDFSRPDYGANRRLLAGEAQFEVRDQQANRSRDVESTSAPREAHQARVAKPERPVLTLRSELSEEALQEIARVSGRSLAPVKASAAVETPEPQTASKTPAAEPHIGGIDLSQKEYAANRKLVSEAAHFEIETNKRNLAFTPTSIPDTREEMEPGNHRFGEIDRRARASLDELNYSSAMIESGSSIIARIDLRGRVPAIDPAGGAARFLDAVENNDIGRQKANEAELAARAREFDKRFLDANSRDTVSAEIRAEFNEHAEKSHDEIRKDASATLSTISEQERELRNVMAAMNRNNGRGM